MPIQIRFPAAAGGTAYRCGVDNTLGIQVGEHPMIGGCIVVIGFEALYRVRDTVYAKLSALQGKRAVFLTRIVPESATGFREITGSGIIKWAMMICTAKVPS